jgi:hypothetical protein
VTEQELIEIEARAAEATPGPWKWNGGQFEDARLQVGDKFVLFASLYMPRGNWEAYVDVSDADMDFIAASRTDVPALVAEVRRLRAELAEYQDRVALVIEVRRLREEVKEYRDRVIRTCGGSA